MAWQWSKNCCHKITQTQIFCRNENDERHDENEWRPRPCINGRHGNEQSDNGYERCYVSRSHRRRKTQKEKRKSEKSRHAHYANA